MQGAGATQAACRLTIVRDHHGLPHGAGQGNRRERFTLKLNRGQKNVGFFFEKGLDKSKHEVYIVYVVQS